MIAASFSQTYLRNAFNNGFVCIECPELVAKVRDAVPDGEKTWVPGDEIEIDFGNGAASWRGEAFSFAPLGEVPQGLVVAGCR